MPDESCRKCEATVLSYKMQRLQGNDPVHLLKVWHEGHSTVPHLPDKYNHGFHEFKIGFGSTLA